MEQKKEYWENKIIRGIGTLYDFTKAYDDVNSVPGQFVVASTILPTGQAVDDSQSEYKIGIHEWVIYYKRNPNSDKVVGTDGKIESKPEQVTLALE